MTYKYIKLPDGSNSTTIWRIADKASIPADPSNRDYKEYLKWVEAGNTPEAAD
tara:strand:+ start:2010 stop:2168 length:159 start_codon:yes stop_codon:yes gene_type:complete